jgi:hypothetical protein
MPNFPSMPIMAPVWASSMMGTSMNGTSVTYDDNGTYTMMVNVSQYAPNEVFVTVRPSHLLALCSTWSI